jgi:Mg2+/Co2+ transporter CorB
LVAAIVGGVGLGALLAAVSAGFHTLGEAGLQALSEGEDRNAKVAGRVLRDLPAVQSRLLMGRVLCVALAAAFVAYSLLHSYGLWTALLGVVGTSVGYAIVATIAGAVVRASDLEGLEVVEARGSASHAYCDALELDQRARGEARARG